MTSSNTVDFKALPTPNMASSQSIERLFLVLYQNSSKRACWPYLSEGGYEWNYRPLTFEIALCKVPLARKDKEDWVGTARLLVCQKVCRKEKRSLNRRGGFFPRALFLSKAPFLKDKSMQFRTWYHCTGLPLLLFAKTGRGKPNLVVVLRRVAG